MVESPATTAVEDELLFPETLLTTKLYIPRTPPSLVSRPQLLARLNAGWQRRPGVALLSAPPGFGKTTLLSEWLTDFRFGILDFGSDTVNGSIQNPKSKIQNVAWLSLDEGDNDSRRFLTYCIAALQTIQPKAGQTALAGLYRHPSQPLAVEHLLTPLLNEIAAIPGGFIFVFDDYHVIKSKTVQAGLSFLLNHLPPQGYLVIASRTEPSLPLTRLRGRGQLTELHAADLSFTPDETAQFLTQVMGLHLSPEEVRALDTRTEGWIAGLQLAALSMQGLKDTASFVKAFTGTHRYVLDYLLEEVLQRQPDNVQKFLLQTSILNRLTGPLCDAVTSDFGFPILDFGLEANPKIQNRKSEIVNSQEMLHQLERDNLFIIPLDDERRWYRYHQLFADLLYHRLELAEKTEGTIAGLHRRASDWYEQNGFTSEAMHHALAALDTVRSIRLVKQKAAALLSRSELIALLNWLDHIPQAMIRSRSRASLLLAWAMLLTGQLESVEAHLQAVEQALKMDGADTPEAEAVNLKGEITTIRAAMAYFRRDMSQAIELFRQALARLEPGNLFLRGAVLQTLGAAYSWQGNVVEASRTFAEARVVSQATGNTQVVIIALGSLAQLWVERGDLHQADKAYQEALQLLGWPTEPEQLVYPAMAGRIYIGLAELAYQWNDLEAAQHQLMTGLKLAEAEPGSGILAGGYLLMARLRQAQGQAEGILEAMRRATWLAQQYTGPYYWANEVAIYQARLWLEQGNFRAIENWARDRGLWPVSPPETIPYLREGEYLFLARWLLAEGQQQADKWAQASLSPFALAATLLEQITGSARQAKRIGRVLEALILQAMLFQAQANKEQALTFLSEALTLAEPEGYIRLFVDEGPALVDLLQLALSRGLTPSYVNRLLANFSNLGLNTADIPIQNLKSKIQNLVDPLSDRELEILRLIAAGLSNKALADQLFLTTGTVKWHLNNIYSKLDAHSRTHAVARARELGVI